MYRRWSQGEVLFPSVVSIVTVLATSFPVVVASSSVLSTIFVTEAPSVVFSVLFPRNRTFPNSVSQACAYQSLWVVLTSGSGR